MLPNKEILDAVSHGEGDKVIEYLEYKFEEQSKSQNKQFIISTIFSIINLIMVLATLILTILSLVL